MSGVAEYGAALVLSGVVALLILRVERVIDAIARAGGATLRRLPFVRVVEPTPLRPLPGTSRPIELIAHDVRRLRHRRRTLPRGASFAKVEGVRRAYDDVLREACTSLEIVTLIGVLPCGTELDLERERVERLLDYAGLDTDAA